MRCSATRRLSVLSLVSFTAAATATTGFAGQTSAQTAPAQPSAPTVDETADACFGAAERAQPLLRQKRFREARVLLEICARDTCPHSARSDCREWLAEAIDAQSSVVIAAHEVRGSGDGRTVRNVNGVRAVIDEALVIDGADQAPISIDPGRHRIRVERAGSDAVVLDVDVREGEKSRVIDVFWHLPDIAPFRPIPASVYVTGAIAIVASGVGAYFEIAGFSSRDQLDTSCRPRRDCTPAQVALARAQVGVGDAALGGGLLFFASAAILYFTRPVADAPPTKDHTAWTLDVAPVGPGRGFFAGVRRGW
jgi:hypothetical protein